jgi:hypothetical protein
VVWLFGNRMWLLGAAAGALLALALTRLVPSLSGGWLELVIVVAFAIILGGLGFIGKAFAKIIAMVLGFIAGGAVVFSLIGLFSTSVSFWTWIAALVGGLIGAGLFSRFIDWGLIIFASLLGSTLAVRGAMEAFSLSGTIASVAVVVLTVLGIFYHARKK